MPELPEVQTVVSELEAKIKNKIISRAEVLAGKSVNLPMEDFIKLTKNKKVLSVARRAKLIIIDLEGKWWLLTHLKMTGQFVFCEKDKCSVSGGHAIANLGDLPNKFSRVVLHFKGGSKLFFNDIRRFGWVRLVDEKQLIKELSKYGPEPLSSGFNSKVLTAICLRYKNRKIKQILLDQTLVAGLGNIYVDESCFEAGILPTRTAGSLSGTEINKLAKAIKYILRLAISKKGTSANTYIHTDGSKGNMLKYLKVYQRTGEVCKRCGGKISKVKLNGRSTHFCTDCQK
jgi:formamidopyrimidine-DNA glycosylase